ncbi:hypothetical protein BD770DRAFT_456945 [Pilaira anomala]|nr:hypothetical protein BD770DRAFT_456945 [Pilaira anomala]
MVPNSTVGQGGSNVSKKSLNWRVIEPKDFSGEDLGNEAFVWLKKMERFKNSAKLSDEEILCVTGDHLVKKAETWFNVVGIKATTWDQFVVLFKKQYLVDQEDKCWFCLQTMKQGDDDSIDDIALKMEELFELLDDKSQVFQVRTFLSAILPKIAFEVEKEGTPVSFQAAKTKANSVSDLRSEYSKNRVFKNDNYSSDSASVTGNSEVSSLVAKLEQLSINLVKLNEGVNLKSTSPKPYVPYNNNVNNDNRNIFTCFYCREEGHKKYDCLKFLREQGQGSNCPATGSNTVPIGENSEDSGKGNEQQDLNPQISGEKVKEGQEIRLVDTMVVGNGGLITNEILVNGVKRRAVAEPSSEAVVVDAVPVVVTQNKKRLQRVRPKARRFPVKLKRSKVWSKMLNTEAGISVAEWLYFDKDAAAKVVDGLRYLKESKVRSRKKVSSWVVGAGGNGVTIGNGVGVLGVGSNLNGVTAGVGGVLRSNAMDIGILESTENEIVGDGNSINEVDFENGSYDTETGTESDYDSSSFSGSKIAGEASDLEFSEIESVYGYPYDLQKMKSSSPLRAVISINGKNIEAVFDTGASVSILGSDVCTSLWLVPNCDNLHLVGFNSESAPSTSNVVINVPITISGKIRPEHMAVQFQAYGISLDIQNSQVRVSTSNGIIKVQGRTSRIIRIPTKSKREQEIYTVATTLWQMGSVKYR